MPFGYRFIKPDERDLTRMYLFYMLGSFIGFASSWLAFGSPNLWNVLLLAVPTVVFLPYKALKVYRRRVVRRKLERNIGGTVEQVKNLHRPPDGDYLGGKVRR